MATVKFYSRLREYGVCRFNIDVGIERDAGPNPPSFAASAGIARAAEVEGMFDLLPKRVGPLVLRCLLKAALLHRIRMF